MHIGEDIPTVLCLIELGILQLCFGLSIERWKEESKFILSASTEVPHSNKKTFEVGYESYDLIGRSFVSDESKRSIAKKAINPVDSANNKLKSLEEIAIGGRLETLKRQKLSDIPILDKVLKINNEILSLPFSIQRYMDTNVSGYNALDCPDIHQLCGQPRKLITNWQCSCQEDCLIYGDCCSDMSIDNINKKSDKNVECISFKGTFDSYGYYMVAHCPENWTNQNTKYLCENKNIFEHDPLRHVPVTSTLTNRTYRNLFCAVCNNDNYIVAWKIPKECKTSKNPFYYNVNCNKDFHPPIREKTPKLCNWNVISSCPKEFRSDEIRRKCFYYYEPIKHINENRTKFMYKNKFCLFCNDVQEELYCPNVTDFNIFRVTPYIPLAVLLDVNFNEGGTAVGKMIRCEPGHIFDPWMEECRSVFCGRLYEYRDGKCIKSFVSKENEQYLFYNSTLDSDCFKVSVNSSDYVAKDNGTIILLASEDILQPGEYETLQNYSILICAPESTNYIEKFSDAQNYLTIACLSISMCCLLVKIILFFALPEPRKVPTLVVIFLSVSLLIAQFLFLAGSNQSKTAFCVCVGVALHFFILASVFWTNVLAFDIWKTFSTMRSSVSGYNNNNNLIYYAIYSWGTPLSIVFVGSIVEWTLPWSKFSPEYGLYFCWISNRIALLLFFAVPLGIILIVNIIFFTMTAVTIAKTSKVAKFARQSTGENNHIRFALYVKLALVMGLTWIFGFVSAYTNNIVMWYLFTIFNGLQGAFILLAFSHFKRHSLKNSSDKKSTGSGTKSSLTNSANSRTSKE